MRRSAEGEDSTDLLLDAICNMFGLFIFVAMLVTLLVSVQGPRIVRDAEQATREEIADPRLAPALAETAALRSAIDRFDDDALREEQSAVAAGDAAVAAAEAELARRRELVETYRRRLDAEQELDRGLAEQLPRLEVEITRLEAELSAAREQKDVSVRTPRRRELADRVPAQVVIARGRVFVVNDWSDRTAHPCDSWCTWNPAAVDEARSEAIVHYCWRAGGQHIDRTIALRGGILVTDSGRLSQSGEWNRALAGLDPRRHVISFKVDPDSFDRFGAVRAAIARKGFLYDVSPVVIDPVMDLYRDTIREGATTAQ
jgi:hypothetical protein